MLVLLRPRTFARLSAAEGALIEKERLVQALVEQVEYLRGQLGQPTLSVTQAVERPLLETVAVPEVEKPIQVHSVEQLSVDEEELHAMRQAGVIDQDEFERALANLNDPDIIE